jgi:5-methylcytosine-specific restriction endonuclease McrA
VDYILNRRVLLLNQSYQPLMVIGAKRALILLLTEKVEAIENYTEFIHSMYFKMPLPSVIRLRDYARFAKKEIVLSRKNILKRDNHICQYCGAHSTRLTIDHIIPRQKGGPDTWENLVTACVQCNTQKGHKSVSEAKMELQSSPRKPMVIVHFQKNVKQYQKMWRPYLFMEKH